MAAPSSKPRDVVEVNFDGLVGPTHNYAGLSRGNLASDKNRGLVSNPRGAALQGLDKMKALCDLGVAQALLPPQLRPDIATLRAVGFTGSDEQVLARAYRDAPWLVWNCGSASAMWTANAATVAPSSDTIDGRVHLTPANLVQMFHRSLEPSATRRALEAIFARTSRFVVHAPLPAHPALGDEGAANHSRLETEAGVVHLFGWGRSAESHLLPKKHPARQTLFASQSVARLNQLKSGSALFWQQEPRGIDQGAFHSDVLAVANERFLMLHELAFVEPQALLNELSSRLGDGFCFVLATESELPASDAVRAYPFNSQVITRPDGGMTIIAPAEARETPSAARFLDRVINETNPVDEVRFIDVRQSMSNGGGPACLRLRVPLNSAEREDINARLFLDQSLFVDLKAWIERHYRDRLTPDDLGDPKLLDETRRALDELTHLLALGNLYEFQGS